MRAPPPAAPAAPALLCLALLAVALLAAPPAAAQTPADGVPLGAYSPAVAAALDGSLESGALPEDWTLEEGGEEEPAEAPAAEPAELPAEPATLGSRISAAVWCPVRSGPATAAEEGESPPLACDFGPGAAFLSRRLGEQRVSAVVAIGLETFVVGFALTAEIGGRPVSIGVGMMVPHGGGAGIDLSLAAPALGATFGFQGGGEG
jgi:hypothetical protein